MLLNRIHKRVPKLLKMIAQINYSILISPAVYETTTSVLNPPFVSIKFQFCSNSRLKQNPKASLNESTIVPTASCATRLYRNARTEAQGVLFDYLHCIRNFSITDADHISKNSPKFLKKLLFKIYTEKEVANALTRFLRYNPINEFEPFFESLGLRPSEFRLLLPRHLMYLSDDPVMFENYHALCNYGIPRSKIGRMYKEAREIFEYDYGVLALKLQDFLNAGLSKATVIELVSCCPLLLIDGVNCGLVKCVEKLKLLGLGMDWIGENASYNCTFNWNRMLDTMDFLDNVGYTKEQMCNLLKTNPTLLLQGSGKNVYVLFGRLLKLGVDMSDVYSLFMQYPQVFSAKWMGNLLQAIDFLIEVEMGTDEIADVVANNMEFLCSSRLRRPITASKPLEVGTNGLLQIIRKNQGKVLILATKRSGAITSKKIGRVPLDHGKELILSSRRGFKKHMKISFLLRLGYGKNSEEMMEALKKFKGSSDQLDERFDCLVEAGFDCNVVANIVRQSPSILHWSKDMILKKVSFLSRLGYDVNSEDMMKAFITFTGRGDRLQERFDCLVEAGLDCSVVTNVVRKLPKVLNRNTDILVEKLRRLKCLGYPLESVGACPEYLCYDMRRTSARLAMFSWLREKRAVNPNLCLTTILAHPVARFERLCVNIHPEGPAMWESLKKQYAEQQ